MRVRLPRYTLLLLLALAGVALELYAMRTGPGIRGDSVRYVMGARNILAGNGFSRLSGGGEVFPETGFAPLLSFVLTGFGLVGIDMFAGVRTLNALFFGGSLFLVGSLIEGASRSRWVGLLGAGLVLTAPNVFEWYANVMSEGLFIFLTLLALYSLVTHIQTGRQGLLYVSAISVGMASLARYAGVSLIPAGGVVILLWGSGPRRERIIRATQFCLLATLPFFLWMARNQEVGGAGLANRQIVYHAVRPERLKVFLFQPTTWVIPESIVLPRVVRGGLALLVFCAGPALFVAKTLRRRTTEPEAAEEPRAILPWLLLILVPSYVGVLVINSLLLDAGTTYDGVLRYLTPLFVLLVLLELTSYALAFPPGGTRWPMAVLAVACLSVVMSANARETLMIAGQSTFEMGFTRIRAEWLDLASDLRAAPTIITDNPEMVYYLIDRPAYTMPIKFDQYQQRFREDYPQQIELARVRLEAGAVLVVFGEPSDEEAEVIGLLQVVPLRTYDDVVVYGYPS